MTYDQILAQTKMQHLNLGAPRLRLLPPPEIPLDEWTEIDAIAWAKERVARGLRFRGTPVPPPQREPRPTNESYLRLRHEAHRQILSALPATIEQLIAATGRSKANLHKRLHEMLDEGLVQSVRMPGRAPAYMWHSSTSTPAPENGDAHSSSVRFAS
jgi:hypothetical protein